MVGYLQEVSLTEKKKKVNLVRISMVLYLRIVPKIYFARAGVYLSGRSCAQHIQGVGQISSIGNCKLLMEVRDRQNSAHVSLSESSSPNHTTTTQQEHSKVNSNAQTSTIHRQLSCPVVTKFQFPSRTSVCPELFPQSFLPHL